MNLDSVTEKIIGISYEVSNVLGFGFLEKVYENALMYELKKNGLRAENQKAITVKYKKEVVGEFIADIIVEDDIILELKSVKALSDVHKAQLLNYLKATNKKIGLLLNFGNPKVEIKRIVNNY